MLANGTQPRKIIPYLSDCYDALAGLRFVQVCVCFIRIYKCMCLNTDTNDTNKTQDEDGKESARTVDMMIAKDRERVPLHQPFTMEGV